MYIFGKLENIKTYFLNIFYFKITRSHLHIGCRDHDICDDLN